MEKEFDQEVCNVKHSTLNRLNAILFTLIVLFSASVGYAITLSYAAQSTAIEVKYELQIWQATRLESQKNTDRILLELRDEVKDMNINFKKHLSFPTCLPSCH
jgi:hypothetical protein